MFQSRIISFSITGNCFNIFDNDDSFVSLADDSDVLSLSNGSVSIVCNIYIF